MTHVRVWVAVGITLVAADAHAQQLSNEGRAEQLFQAGQKKFDSGDYEGACTDFSESLKLGPKLGTLMNLALCHETVNRPVTAWREFSHAAVWASQNNQRDRYDYAREHIRSLEQHLPRVVLQLPADRALESLEIDGDPVPESHWYLPLYLDPGVHQLAVSAPGKRRTTVSFRVTSSPSDQLVYVPGLPPETVEKGGVVVDTQQRSLGIAGLGAGLVGVAAGTVFGVMAMTSDDHEAVKGRATGATISFAAGALFAVVGGYLFWTATTPRR